MPKTITTRRCHFCGMKHAPMFHRYARRNLYQRIDKMEAMKLTALARYASWFRNKGLILADFIVLHRLGVPMKNETTPTWTEGELKFKRRVEDKAVSTFGMVDTEQVGRTLQAIKALGYSIVELRDAKELVDGKN